MTVHEVSERTNVSVRTLRYYDRIGLLPPQGYTESGYRIYSENELQKLQTILLFRELEFSLAQIKEIINDPQFDKNAAISAQIALLEMKKQRLCEIIAHAKALQKEEQTMNFTAFDEKKLEEYKKKAKSQWGSTAEYRACLEKTKNRAAEEERALSNQMMEIFRKIGSYKNRSPAEDAVQSQIKNLQAFISEQYYPCKKEILQSLGAMYAAGGEFTENIDRAGGTGTAEFCRKAIEIYCK